jgi:hypothetical protein
LKKRKRFGIILSLLLVLSLATVLAGCGKKEVAELDSSVELISENTGPEADPVEDDSGGNAGGDYGQQDDGLQSDDDIEIGDDSQPDDYSGYDEDWLTDDDAEYDDDWQSDDETEDDDWLSDDDLEYDDGLEYDEEQSAEVMQDKTNQPDAAAELDRDGTYTTKEDVALYIHLYGKLPSNFITKKQAKKYGWTGGSLEDYAPGKCIGGDYFGNYEGLLPKDQEYYECDIDTLGKNKRGAKRIIYSDEGYIYYTEDHYESFELLYSP